MDMGRRVNTVTQEKETLEQLIDGARRGVPLKEMNRLYMTYMLAKNGNNKVHTAAACGVDRRTLQRLKIQLQGVPTP